MGAAALDAMGRRARGICCRSTISCCVHYYGLNAAPKAPPGHVKLYTRLVSGAEAHSWIPSACTRTTSGLRLLRLSVLVRTDRNIELFAPAWKSQLVRAEGKN